MAKKHITLHFLSIALLIIGTGCSSRDQMPSFTEYNAVETGMTLQEMEQKLGKPYAVHNKKEGTFEYEYIERIDRGAGVVIENHYFVIVQDGKVVGKYFNREQSPPYDLIYQDQPNYSP